MVGMERARIPESRGREGYLRATQCQAPFGGGWPHLGEPPEGGQLPPPAPPPPPVPGGGWPSPTQTSTPVLNWQIPLPSHSRSPRQGRLKPSPAQISPSLGRAKQLFESLMSHQAWRAHSSPFGAHGWPTPGSGTHVLLSGQIGRASCRERG